MGLIRPLAALAVLLAVVAFVIGAAPPAVVTTDLHGDPLPKGAFARLGTTRLRHGDPLSGVAFSRDGKTLASVASDHVVRLWNPATGKESGSFGEQLAYANVYQTTRWLSCVAVSADGKTVASGTRYGIVTIWDSATGKELHRLTPTEGVVSLDFAPDGKSLATVARGVVVRVWDTGAGKELYQLTGQVEGATLVRFSPDGKTVATGGSLGSVRLWDVNTKKEQHKLAGHGGAINALAFSGDGKRLASGSGEGKLIVWDVATAKEQSRFDGHRGGVVGLGLTHDGKTLVSAGASDGEIRLCDVAKGKARILTGPPDVLTAAALSPDGKSLALGGHQGTVFLWDLTKGRDREPDGHRGRVHFLAFSDDGRRIVSAGGEGSFWVWDSANGRPLRKTLLVEDTSRASLGAGGGTGVTFAFSAGGRFAVTRKKNGGIGLYQPATGKELRQLRDKGSLVTCGALTADGRTLAVGEPDGTIRIYDADRGRELRKLTAHKGQVMAAALSPDGAVLASIGAERTLRVWGVNSGTEIWQAELSELNAAWKVAISPDGRCLAVGSSSGIVRVWEVASGKQVRQFSGHNGYVGSLCFSPDGRSLAVGSWISVRLWDLASGKPRGELRCHRGDVPALAFSADSKVLATGGTDSTALLWQVARAFPAAPAPAVLGDKDLMTRWDDLAGDAEKAYQATHDLAGAPAQAAQLLGKHLRPVPKADAKRLKKLIEDLGSDDDDVSKGAARELEKLGEAAVPALREALKGAEDVDVRLRLSVLINDATAAVPPPERLRTLRAVHALELAGTREAVTLLKTLASGAAEGRLTVEAKAALARLAARPTSQR